RAHRPSFRRRVFSMRRLGESQSDQARAKQDKAANRHGEETLRSEFVTHGAPPIARPCSNRTTVPSRSQKDSAPNGPIRRGLMISCNTRVYASDDERDQQNEWLSRRKRSLVA